MASSVYPIPPGEPPYETGYRYEDASQQLPRAVPPPPQAQYEEQAIDPTQQHTPLSQQQSPVGQTPTRSKNPGEVKPRLRKACDSCSVRKVKVNISNHPRSANANSCSVMRAVLHASHVPRWTFLAHSTAQVDEGDPRIDMLKLSSDRGWKMAPTT